VTTIVHAENGFAADLRRWRTARRLSQLELALRAGTTQRHLSFIERGRSRPGRGRHILESLRNQGRSRPDPRLDALLAELQGYVPAAPPGPDYLGFAVPLRLATRRGELRLLTTLTSFATATDITLAELRLEAFLPADAETADILREHHSTR
jgi:transcriptional regulator with XRE-family HTH domain